MSLVFLPNSIGSLWLYNNCSGGCEIGFFCKPYTGASCAATGICRFFPQPHAALAPFRSRVKQKSMVASFSERGGKAFVN